MSKTSTPKPSDQAAKPSLELDDIDEFLSMDQDATLTDREAEALEKTIFLSDIEDKGETEHPVISQDTKGKNCDAVIGQGAESVASLSIKLGNLDVEEKPLTKSARRRRNRRARHGSGGDNNKSVEVDKPRNDKRPRELGESSETRPPKRYNYGPKKAYNEVVKGSMQLIIIKLSEEDEMTDLAIGEADSIKDFLLEKLDEATTTGARPHFTGVRVLASCLEINCADSATVEWVKGRIPELGSLKLCVKAKDELPKLVPVSLMIPDKPVKESVIFKRLETQNEGLNTRFWRTFHRGDQTSRGRFFVFGVDPASLNYIKAHKSELFYGLRQVSVGLKPTKAAQ
jgi:Domain of unknown function (DUF4780)